MCSIADLAQVRSGVQRICVGRKIHHREAHIYPWVHELLSDIRTNRQTEITDEICPLYSSHIYIIFILFKYLQIFIRICCQKVLKIYIILVQHLLKMYKLIFNIYTKRILFLLSIIIFIINHTFFLYLWNKHLLLFLNIFFPICNLISIIQIDC